jgi:hypothetical protein
LALIDWSGACSFWPDGIGPFNWEKCCEAHDFAYANMIPKDQADIALALCVNHVLPGMGIVMLIGVTLFGAPFYIIAAIRYLGRRRG